MSAATKNIINDNSNGSGSVSEYDFLLKVVIVGDSGVGKSSLLKQFSNREFTGEYVSTIGVDFEINTLLIDGKIVKLQIWDTAGQERFQHITTSYYRGAHCIVLVYDVTQYDTFEHVHKWYQQINENCNPNVNILLVGNKSDLTNSRQVPYEEAEKVSKNLGISLFETSAKNATNVDQSFSHIAQQAINKGIAPMTHQTKNVINLEGKKEISSQQSSPCCFF